MKSQEPMGALAELEVNSANLAQQALKEIAEDTAREEARAKGEEYIPPTQETPEEEEEDNSAADGKSESEVEETPKEKPEEEEDNKSEDSESEEKDDDKSDSEEEEEEEEKEETEESQEDFESSIVKAYVDDTTMSEDDAKAVVSREKELAGQFKVPYNKETQLLLKSKRHSDDKIKTLGTKVNQYEKHVDHMNATQKRTVDDFVKAIELGKVPNPKTKALMSEQELVDLYRKYDPKLTEDIDDEKVKEMAARQLKAASDRQQEHYLSNIKTNAKSKRVEILENLPEYGKEFTKEVRDIVKGMSDEWILDDGFDVEYVVKSIRGGKPYDDLKSSIDKIREDAFEAGKKDRKITAQKKSAGKGVSSGKPTSSGTKASIGLSDNDKRVALEQYGGMTEEDAYEAYEDFLNMKRELTKKE